MKSSLYTVLFKNTIITLSLPPFILVDPAGLHVPS